MALRNLVSIGWRVFVPGTASLAPAFATARLGQNQMPSWERRLTGVSIAAAIAVVFASTNRFSSGRMSSIDLKKRGMELFTQGDVCGSLEQFNKVYESSPEERLHLWQRGLSLFYLDRFEEGAAQFREDTKLGNNDSEEAVWCCLCEARYYGLEDARKRMPDTGEDRRPYMNQVYKLFKQGGDPQQMLSSFLRGDNGQAFFYAKLYAGLYYEAMSDLELAKSSILSACESSYASLSSDYMISVARVHCKTRKWC